MRTLVIGDIHGCLRALTNVIDAAAPARGDRIVFLGDYVDRGPDSRGVLDYLIALTKRHNLITLAGNHEEMMLAAREEAGLLRAWTLSGGDVTLASYKVGVPFSVALAAVPDEHWRFVEACGDYHETASHIFVHGYVDPALPMSQQEPVMLRWQKFHDPKPHVSGKTILCGHTAQRDGNPINKGFAICLDTCAYGGGWLTCMEVESGRLWQANQQGHLRTGVIGPPRV